MDLQLCCRSRLQPHLLLALRLIVACDLALFTSQADISTLLRYQHKAEIPLLSALRSVALIGRHL